MRFEMRWLVRPGWDGPEKELQYRYEMETIDYSMHDSKTGGFLRTNGWSSWITVPTVDETK